MTGLCILHSTSPDQSELGKRLNHLLREAIACVEDGELLFVCERDHQLHPFASEVVEPYGGATLANREAQEEYIRQLTVRLLRTGLAAPDLLARIADGMEALPAATVRKQLGARIPRSRLKAPDNAKKLAAIDAYTHERRFLESRDADEEAFATAPVIAAYDSYFRDEAAAEATQEPSAFARDRQKRVGFDRAGSWSGKENFAGLACTRASKRLVDAVIPLLRAVRLERRSARAILESLGFGRDD